MTNAQINQKFLAVIDAKTRWAVLNAIADHYGITLQDSADEVTDSEAEHLLDYLTGSIRTATHLLMKRHGLVTW